MTRWERAVQDAEDELEGGRQAEAKQRQEIDAELRKVDALKAERASARARQDHADEDVNKVRTILDLVIGTMNEPISLEKDILCLPHWRYKLYQVS